MGTLRTALVALLLAAGHGWAWAAACTSDSTGDWSSPGTWGTPAAGCVGAPGGIPGINDTVTIANLAHTVTVSDARIVGQVTLAAGNQSATLQILNGASLTLETSGAGNPDLTINAPNADNRTKLVHVQSGGTLLIERDLLVTGGSNATRLSEVRVDGGGILTVNRDIQLNNNVRSRLILDGASTLELGRDMTETGTFSCAACTLNLIGATDSDIENTFVYFNVVDLKTGGAESRFQNDVTIHGSITNNGGLDLTQNTPVITLGGSGVQTIGGSAASTTITAVTVNQGPGGSVTLGHDLVVATTLTLTSGIINAGANTVVLASTAGTTLPAGSATSYVNGCLRKNFPADGGAPFPSLVFHIGSGGTAYTPVSFAFTSATSVGDITACVVPTDHPQVSAPVASTGIDAARSVNRYWTLTPNLGGTGTPNGAYSATFTFLGTDVDGGATPANFIVQRYDGTNWFPTTTGTLTGTSSQATGVTGYGAFAIGEPLAGVTASPGGLNTFESSTPAGAIQGKIQTKVAGVSFALDIVGITAGAPTPVTANVAVEVHLLDSSNNAGAVVAATACNANWTSVQVLSTAILAFVNGRATLAGITVPQAYKDARIRVHFPVGPVGGATIIGCSTDRFAVRPQSITPAALDETWTTPAAGTPRTLDNVAASGGTVHKAGQPFTLRVAPVPASAGNYASAGNHTGTPSVLSSACAFPTPGTCTACTNGTLTLSSFTAGSGFLTDDAATYTEAGLFTLALHDTDFAAVDGIDGSPATYSNAAPFGRLVPQTAALTIGRFVPDNFLVATNNVPQLRTFGSTCGARSFTYLGQPFGYVAASEPQVLVTAREAGGGTTTNYRECLWKIANTAPADVTQTYTNVAGPVIDVGLAGNAPTITPGNGTGTVTVNAADRIAYTRSLTTPIMPFNANITLGIQVRDNDEADGQITSNTATFNGVGPAFAGIAFDAGVEFRYGRARVLNAVGSEKLDLPVPLRTEYYTGDAFVTNAADSCTTFAPKNFVLSNPQGGVVLNSGAAPPPPPALNMFSPTAGSDGNVGTVSAVSGGVATLTLLRPTPTATSPGSIDICLDLGADVPAACTAVTPAAQSWLQNKASGTDYDDDPVGRAAFGLYGSQPNNFIFFRENF
jgi:hypothetical protein